MNERPSVICEKCGIEVSKNNLEKHRDSKSCISNQEKGIKDKFILPDFVRVTDKKFLCTICNKEYSKMGIGSHIWRSHTDEGKSFNPNVGYSTGIRSGWNKGLSKETDVRVRKSSETLSKNIADGKIIIKGCCTKEYNQSDAGRASSSRGGGFRENAGRSKKFKVTDSFGNILSLQSTYELRCMNILNELNIKWSRPKALKYVQNEKIKNYFGDFYLNDFDIILDPKNNYKANCDEEKITLVNEQNSIRVYVLLEEQITKEYIRGLI